VVRRLIPGRVFLLSKISDLPGHEADYSPQSGSEVKNECNISRAVTGPIFIYTCMRLTGLHRNPHTLISIITLIKSSNTYGRREIIQKFIRKS
jgi:hypothetical protein